MLSQKDDEFLKQIQKRHELAKKQYENEFKSEEGRKTEKLKDKDIFSLKKFLEQHNGVTVKDVIGFTEDELDELTSLVNGKIPSTQNKSKMGLKEQIFVALLYATWNDSFRKLKTFIDIPKSTIQEIFDRVVNYCFPIWINKFIPQKIIPCKSAFINFPDCIGAIDTTTITTNKPSLDSELKKLTWDGKNKKNGFKIETIVNPDGIAIFVKAGIPASQHDFGIFKSTKVIDFLSYKSGNRTKINPILADKGYTGLEKFISEEFVMWRKTVKDKSEEEINKHNNEIAEDRQIVERWYGRMKSVFTILGLRYRGNRNKIEINSRKESRKNSRKKPI